MAETLNMALLADIMAPALFALGCALLTMILLRRSYRYFGSRTRKRDERPLDLQPRPVGAWSGAHSDASARVERQMVELHERSREVTATIDNKLILLQQLVAQSQRQIDRLEELLAEAEEKQPQMHADER